jgi:hypothetical protein
MSHQPGTILAFSGTGPISWGIRWRTWSQWSHVGLIVDITADDVEAARYYAGFSAGRFDHVKAHPPGLCLLESTTMLDCPCLVTGQPISGVQCTLPQNRIDTYRGRVASLKPIRPLEEWQRAELTRLALSQCGTPYDGRGVALLGTVAWKYLRGPRMADRNSLWCSEIVEMDLRRIRLGNPCLKSGYASPRNTVEWHGAQENTHEKPKWETRT